MLRSAKELKNYSLRAVDGEIGRSKDLLFDDRTWALRYLVADTRKWLPGRRVLISPITMERPDWSAKTLSVRLTRQQIEESPPLSEDAPVSRQHEVALSRSYAMPAYWAGPEIWGLATTPFLLADVPNAGAEGDAETEGDPHLRSVDEVTGYSVATTDSEDVGRVDDFIIDDESWVIRYLVVDARQSSQASRVLISPDWASEVDWGRRMVSFAAPTTVIESSPAYDPRMPINREYEAKLYDFHGRPAYWQ